LRKNELETLQNEVIQKTQNILKKERMIAILSEKKMKMKENLEKIMQKIGEKKRILETEAKKLFVEKTEEKNAHIMINNIRRLTFSLVLE